jgi:type I restriction enzyme S subunit
MTSRPDYELTEVGEIPAEWHVRPLSDLITRLENGLNYKQTSNKEGIPITRIETISAETIDAERIGLVNGLSDDEVRSRKLHVGDILFSHINSVEHIGKTAIYRGEPPVLIHGMNLLLIRPNTERVSPLFLIYYLKYGTTRNRFKSLAKKAVNQASINTAELRTFKLPVPSLAEQDRISSILSAVDDAIHKTDEIIAKTQQLKKGLMQQLLTKGIGHDEFGSTDIGTMPREWEIKHVGEVVNVIDYRGRTPEFSVSGIPHLRSNNIREGRIVFEDLKYVSEKTYREFMSRGIPGIGDIIFTTEGPLGEVALVPEDFRFSMAQRLVVLQPNKEVLSTEFLKYILQDPRIRKEYYSLATGSTIRGVSSARFKRTRIYIAPLHEQQRISSILLSVDQNLEKERRVRLCLERLKKGLMQVLLTGRVRVKVD